MADNIIALGAVFVILLLISFMVLVRMQSEGASGKRAGAVIAELWLTAGVIIALLMAMGQVLGVPPAGEGASRELSDIGVRFGALHPESKRLFVIGAILALGLAAHLMYALSRAMRPARPK